MNNYERYSVGISAAALLVSVVVLFFLVRQLKLLSEQVAQSREVIQLDADESVRENERSRKRATLEFIALTIAKQHELSERVPTPGGPEYAEFAKAASEPGSDAFDALWSYLAYLEDLAVGMNLDIFDDEAVDRSIGDRFVFGWKHNEEWIKEQRQRYGREYLFNELSKVAERLPRIRAAWIVDMQKSEEKALAQQPT